MRLMMTALAVVLLALIGVAPASAGGLQSPATVKAVDNGQDGGVVQDVRHRRHGHRHGYRYGYGYARPYYGYGGYYGSYSYRPRYYYAPYAYYYPAPQYYGYYAPAPRYYYKRKHRDWDDDWDD